MATVGFSPASATLPSAAAKSASSSGSWPGSGGAKTTTSASTRVVDGGVGQRVGELVRARPAG